MADALSFDATAVAPSAPFELLPNGWYTAQIIDSEIKPASSGKGKRLVLSYEVVDGEHKGRKLWVGLNIQHENKTTQDIAQADLSALCHAVDVLKLTSSAQLHQRPHRIKVIVKQDKNDKDVKRNEVKGYEKIGAAASAAPATSAGNVPAWAKKAS